MTTQPPSLEPGSPAPARSRRRVADRPAAPSPSSRRPGRACPEPVERGPSSNQHPRPTAVPRQSAPPNPPSPRLPTRPSHLVRTAPSPAPNWPNSAPPRPQEFFGKNSYARKAPPSRCRRSATKSTRSSVIPASSAGIQQQPASRDFHAAPSVQSPGLTDPSLPNLPTPNARQFAPKNLPQAISGQPVPSGDRLARDSSPLLPQAAAGAHRRPTVTLTPRSPKAREGFAHGRRNHRSRG